MRKLVLAVAALFVTAAIAVPSADAQEYEKDHEKKAKSHMMKGTMTGPEGDSHDVGYAISWGEEGAEGWIVAEEDGEKYKIAMNDLTMDGDYITYNWSPPDEADLVISCNLQKQDDGGYAGDCTDNQEEGRTGQMTVAPMEAMNPCSPEEMKKMKPGAENPCSG